MSRKDNDRAAQGGSIAAHILAFVGVTLLAAVVLLTAAGLMLKFGPSPAAGERAFCCRQASGQLAEAYFP